MAAVKKSAPWEAFQIPRAAPATTNIARLKRQEEAKYRTDIQLRNVPRSALPSDIRRLVQKIRLENITSVQLDYHRFIPTGRAYISISHPSHLEQTLRSLQRSTLTAHSLTMTSSPPIPVPGRSRGVKGRAEAAERGLFDGNGPSSGIRAKGTDVVMFGFPGKLQASALKSYLQSVKLVGTKLNGEPDCETFRIEMPEKEFSVVSRHLVRLPSIAAAHAVVRRLHMTYFQQDMWGKRYPIHARIVY